MGKRITLAELDRALAAGQISEDDYKIRAFTGNPVAWAHKFLRSPENPDDQLELRWYQREMIANPSRFKVVRAGRRVGKCSIYSDTIQLANGSITEIGALLDQTFRIWSMDSTLHFIEDEATVSSNGVKPVYRVTTGAGLDVTVTDNHPLLTFDREGPIWKMVMDLEEGDRIAIPRYIPTNPNAESTLSAEEARLLGYFIGDGSIAHGAAGFCNIDTDVINKWKGCCHYIYPDPNFNVYDDCTYCATYPGLPNNPILDFNRFHGIQGKKAVEKTIPKEIFRQPLHIIKEFIEALWDCDGYAVINDDKARPGKKAIEIGITLSSLELIRGLRSLLLRFGIFTKIKYKKAKYDGKEFDAWRLFIISKEHVNIFYDNFTLCNCKQQKLKEVYEYVNNRISVDKSKDDIIPYDILNIIVDKLDNIGMSQSELNRRSGRYPSGIRKGCKPNRKKLLDYAEVLQDQELVDLATSDLYWDTIESIEYMGEEETFAVSVKKNQNYISNDVLVHNTISVVTEALWHALTERNFDILIVTPNKSQLMAIWEDMRKMVFNSTVAFNGVERFKSGPDYAVHCTNGSKILGIAANQKPELLRGKGAHKIYIDEGDYLNDAVIEAVGSIMMTHKDTEMWVSSTPSGRRAWYWDLCQDKTGKWEKFHYTSMDNPMWDDEMEATMKSLVHTDAAWKHEILADFGEEEYGVFKHQFIDAAIKRGENFFRPGHYRYKDVPVREQGHYYVGVDWNSHVHGVQIVVCEYYNEKLAVVDHIQIQDQNFTQAKAVQAIVDVEKKYNPLGIYVDEGYGHFQIESLIQYGQRVKSSNLDKIVVPVNFSGTVEIDDPLTGKTIKKRTKNFIYDISSRFLSSTEVIILPKLEDVKGGLVDQMREFRVERISQDGREIYSKGNDHTLDAWALAVLAWTKVATGLLEREHNTFVFRVDIDIANRSESDRGLERKLKSHDDPPPTFYSEAEALEADNEMWAERVERKRRIINGNNRDRSIKRHHYTGRGLRPTGRNFFR